MRIVLLLEEIRAHVGGGQISMWNLLEGLEDRGHEVRFVARKVEGEDAVRGRIVYRGEVQSHARWAHVVLTGASTAKREKKALGGVPTIAFIHSAVKHAWRKADAADAIVWASAAMRESARKEGHSTKLPELVVWPTIYPERVRTTPGDRVTLINLIPEKGADLFWELAKRMPDVPFLAVKGGWGTARQRIPRKVPANVEVMDHQIDPREVYARTEILLYPKGKQAGHLWLNGVGMAALEAACSGIPTVAYPGPGLLESLGPAGVWVRNLEAADWEKSIRSLLNGGYAAASKRALERTRHIDPERDVRQLERLVFSVTDMAKAG